MLGLRNNSVELLRGRMEIGLLSAYLSSFSISSFNPSHPKLSLLRK
jgi:hypothetical protein